MSYRLCDRCGRLVFNQPTCGECLRKEEIKREDEEFLEEEMNKSISSRKITKEESLWDS